MSLQSVIRERQAKKRQQEEEELERLRGEHEQAKELITKMRHYIMRHGLLMGECVAWQHLKEMFLEPDER